MSDDSESVFCHFECHNALCLKEEQLKPELLKTVDKEYKKSWELREQYKKLGRAEGFKEAAVREAQERTKKRRYMVRYSMGFFHVTVIVAKLMEEK